ncbi:Uu.00g095440.m01.CDS01 [Anthostomella pinea]|uniref:Uu.00g095440.m01.CDS01 n=1 Tax=Anthostomella pinea TaxID=933095 RepID=A0AAI8VTY3_9PEZI|nr:Uu.00g095440.m01.CDS01 [Anthostomella pinea]
MNVLAMDIHEYHISLRGLNAEKHLPTPSDEPAHLHRLHNLEQRAGTQGIRHHSQEQNEGMIPALMGFGEASSFGPSSTQPPTNLRKSVHFLDQPTRLETPANTVFLSPSIFEPVPLRAGDFLMLKES